MELESIDTLEVMLVDDDPSILELYGQAIDSMPDMCCTSAFDCYESLAEAGSGKFDERLREPHVVLMDIGLPGKGGIEAIDAVRKEIGWKRCSIVMLTINAEKRTVIKAVQSGANGYLHKDVEPVRLIARRLEDLRGGGSPMTPDIASMVLQQIASEGKQASAQSLLTEKQFNVLRRVAIGKTNRQIAKELAVSTDGVAYHLRKIYAKFHLRNKVEAAQWFHDHHDEDTDLV